MGLWLWFSICFVVGTVVGYVVACIRKRLEGV